MSGHCNSYNEFVRELLKDRSNVARYLDLTVKGYKLFYEISQRVLLRALRNVITANGKASRFAEHLGIDHDSFSTTVSAKGNPRLGTIISIFQLLQISTKIAWDIKDA